MRPNKIAIRLALLIVPLELLAAGAGLFWQSSAMIISQMPAGVRVDRVISFIFVLISLSGSMPGLRAFLNIQERPLAA